jgi:pimeloyl-ACP methyl ester carboxylesterase
VYPTPSRHFRVHIPDGDLADLDGRLAATRWPRDAAHAGWAYGPDVADVRRLCQRWRSHDWRATERRLNRYRHVRLDCAGLTMHAMTVAAPDPNVDTVVLLHGWPSSFIEMARLAEHLAHPPRGGAPLNAVVVSLPGYALSDDLPAPGLSDDATATVLAHLLDRLNLDEVWLHAHDMAAGPAVLLALRHPDRILGYHTTEPGLPRADWPRDDLAAEEQTYLEMSAAWDRREGGYVALLATRPASLAVTLTDSPAGLAAWTFDKWHSWSLRSGEEWDWDGPLTSLLLDTLTMQWCAGSVASANRTYCIADTGYRGITRDDRVECPVGVALTTQDIERAPRALAQRLYADIRTWTELGTGGHFIAGERPDLVAASIRSLISSV